MSALGLDSRLKEAWRLMMEESIGTIAIFGQGGIGKTHFMRQLYSEIVSSKHPFDYVIWLTVSSNLTWENIQYEISRKIGVLRWNWEEMSSEEKSQLIHDRLTECGFVLFLDDIWKPVDLAGLGVPNLRDENQGSSRLKIVFTTRSKDACDEMFADHTFKLDMLCAEDAWQLFRAQVGNDRILRHPKIHSLAREMVRRCMGWPILLCAVGRVMSCRGEVYEWNDALEDLEHRSMRGSGTEISSNLLEFCFHALPNHTVKSCLSYFSLFPANFAILKNGLIDFWICEQLLDACDSAGDGTLSLGYNALDSIIAAGLLDEEENNYVKFLDMVRECALSVAIKSQRFGNARLVEATDLDQLETVGRIALMKHSIKKLAALPTNLFSFLLNYNPFTIVKGEISEFMNALTVLDLSESDIVAIPKEISILISLQYLNLSCTWIEYMPIQLKMLTNLKCLNLEHNILLREFPKEVIYGLSSLQVLKMFRCGFSVDIVKENILNVMDMDIDPFLCLEDLKALSITITCYPALHKFFASSKLSSCTQSLSLEVFWLTRSLDISPLAGMKSLLTFEIHDAEVLGELTVNLPLSTLPQEGSFERLERITVEKCQSLRELTWVSLAPHLKFLSVQNCEQMHHIIKIDRLGKTSTGEEHLEPFTKLEVLILESLPALESIYWKILSFQCLKKIEVSECFLLAKLPLNSSSAKANDLVIEGEEEWWNNVIWENDATGAAFIPCFTAI